MQSVSFIAIVVSLHLLKGVNGKCTVTVDGRPATAVDQSGLGKGIHYSYETVSEEGKTLDIVFTNVIDTWNGGRLQSFSIKNVEPYAVCNKTVGPNCTLSYYYSVPNLTHRYRHTRKLESIAVSSENRDVCLLDVITSNEVEKIDFNVKWEDYRQFHELVVEITTGFPGPFTIDQPKCKNVSVFSTSKGAFLVHSEDLKPNVLCSVTVHGRTTADTKTRTIDLPTSSLEPAESPALSPEAALLPWQIATIVVSALLVLESGVVLCVVFCKSTARDQQIHLNTHVHADVSADRQSKPKYSPGGHSGSNSLSENSCDDSDELETDGPLSKPSTSLRDEAVQPTTAASVAGSSQSMRHMSVTVHATQAEDSLRAHKVQPLDEHRV